MLLFVGVTRAGDDWPRFRGPTGQGTSDSVGLPETWSESRHVKWKTAIPGQGWSSPVILGDQIWLTTATEAGHSMRAVCVDRETGKVVRDVEVFRVAKLEPKHDFNSYASPTPVLEAGRVYVSFGNYGNACLDAATGKPVWVSHELKLQHKEGPGASPILHGEHFILHCDGTDAQYVAALDKRTGKLAWKTPRSTDFGDKPGPYRKAYSTPLIVNVGGRDLLIGTGAFRAFAYDPADGREVWSLALPGFSNVPPPVAGHGLVYLATGYNPPELWAVRPDGRGDVGPTHVAWRATGGMPAKPSPLLVGDEIYVVADNGVARCLDARTGKEHWKQRLEGAYTASPIAADGRLYFVNEGGLATVVKPGRTFESIAENELEGRFLASPAVSGRAIFLRSDTHVYRIEK